MSDKTYLLKHLPKMSDKQLETEINNLQESLALAKLERLERVERNRKGV
jgi:hypothetical protein